MTDLGVDTIAPIVRRGVILDIARLEGKDALSEDFEVRPAHLTQASNVEVRPGDVVMIRTGWAQFFSDPKRYINNTAAPGPGIEGAALAEFQTCLCGGLRYRRFREDSKHGDARACTLLVESGIASATFPVPRYRAYRLCSEQQCSAGRPLARSRV
ncbi:MAG: cyclase family protein [Bryobacteraceae bacterium]